MPTAAALTEAPDCPWAQARSLVPAVLHEHRGSSLPSDEIDDLMMALAIAQHLQPGDHRWARIAHAALMRDMARTLSCGVSMNADGPLLSALHDLASIGGYTLAGGEWVEDVRMLQDLRTRPIPAAGRASDPHPAPAGESANPETVASQRFARWSREELERDLWEKTQRLELVRSAYGRLHAVMTLGEGGEGQYDEELIAWARDVASTLLLELGDELGRPAAAGSQP